VPRKAIALITGVVMASSLAVPALAAASTLVSTGNATSVTTVTADLNGVVDTSVKGSEWLFQYGLSSDLSAGATSTPATGAAVGLDAVERQVTGLVSGDTYFWRVVLRTPTAKRVDSTYGRTTKLTTLASTTTGGSTKPYAIAPPKQKTGGVARITNRSARVKDGRIPVEISCTGAHGARCRGELTVTVLHHKSIACGSARLSTFAGRKPTVKVSLSRTCLALLSTAGGHTWPAVVHLAPSTQKAAVNAGVKLVGAGSA
jgi:hypothetical protein